MGRFNKFLMYCNNLDPICQYKYILRGAFKVSKVEEKRLCRWCFCIKHKPEPEETQNGV